MFFPFFLSFPLCFWDFYYTNIDISTLILIALCFTFHLFIPMPYRILKPDLPTCSFSLQLHPLCYSTHLLNSLFPRMPTYSCFMDPFPSFAWYSLCLLHPHRRLGTWIMFPLPQAVNLPFSFHSDYTSQLLITAPCEHSPSEIILLHSQQSLQGTPYGVQVESMVSCGPWGLPPHPPNPPAIPSGMSHKILLPVFNKACFHLRTASTAGASASHYSH